MSEVDYSETHGKAVIKYQSVSGKHHAKTVDVCHAEMDDDGSFTVHCSDKKGNHTIHDVYSIEYINRK